MSGCSRSETVKRLSGTPRKMSGVKKIGNFQFYDVKQIVREGLDTQEMPVFERIDTIYNPYQCNQALLGERSHDDAEAMRRRIILYSPAGIFVPATYNLMLARARGERPGFHVITTRVAYGQLKDVTQEVNDELNLSNLATLVRMAYDDVTPEGWCTVFTGNRVVPN